MKFTNGILCIDVGSGTQDVLYWQPDSRLENCPKFILPSPAKRIAKRIANFTETGTPIYLHGYNMGGGFGGAVYHHLEQGYKIAAHPDAALSLSDDPARLEERGIEVIKTCPRGYASLYLADVDTGFWRSFLGAAGLPEPDGYAIAAQDHGHHPDVSNRQGRFRLWEKLLHEADGNPQSLLYSEAPAELTRLQAISEQTGGAWVTDTGSAAVLGLLFMPEVREQSHKEGICLINIGNSHTVAFLIYKEKIYGVYEQHSGNMTAEDLMADIEQFRRGSLSFDEVYSAWGHGCLTLELPKEATEFSSIMVLGPRRDLLTDSCVSFPAPGGDMMLAGCFGLLHGLALQKVLPE
ncbi:MAG: DUF1786 domain-containing protein [Desulfovibrio sp.]